MLTYSNKSVLPWKVEEIMWKSYTFYVEKGSEQPRIQPISGIIAERPYEDWMIECTLDSVGSPHI